MRHSIVLVLVILGIQWSSCKKEQPEPQNSNPVSPTGTINLEFRNMVGSDSLVLNTQNYTNLNGDTFSVSVFNYYVTNIKLIRSNNTAFVVRNSYYLVKAEDSNSWNIQLPTIPEGEYKAVEFLLGVDSARNVSGAQTGALDPVHGMIWSWATGYIMAKLEGFSPQSSSGQFGFHISGYTGANNVIKSIHLDLPSNASVTESSSSDIKIKADVNEWFQNPSTIKLGITNVIHSPGSSAKFMADNYADMFSVISVEN